MTKSSFDRISKNNPSWQFPQFEEVELFPKKNKYCVCVFVINEGDRIRQQIKSMKRYSNIVDIIIADGGSTDGSLNEQYLRDNIVRSLLVKKGKGKLSAQMRMAFAWSQDQGYEGVIVVDGNNKDDVSAIPLFVEKLKSDYDHIQGSRFIKGGKAINTPMSRHIGLKLVHAPLISLASGKVHTDTTNGFRAYSSDLLSDPKINIFRDIFDTYELHYYLAIEASKSKKYKITEVPTTREYPKKGKTPTKISPIKGNSKILKILILSVMGRYKDKKQQH